MKRVSRDKINIRCNNLFIFCLMCIWMRRLRTLKGEAEKILIVGTKKLFEQPRKQYMALKYVISRLTNEKGNKIMIALKQGRIRKTGAWLLITFEIRLQKEVGFEDEPFIFWTKQLYRPIFCRHSTSSTGIYHINKPCSQLGNFYPNSKVDIYDGFQSGG